MTGKVNRPAARPRPSQVQPLTAPLRVLNRAFDEFDPDYDPIEDYVEVAQRVRREEDAW